MLFDRVKVSDLPAAVIFNPGIGAPSCRVAQAVLIASFADAKTVGRVVRGPAALAMRR
jgi:hypothetical protein